MSDTAVYLGFWRDQTKNAITGSALTVSNQEGLYVIAFLALWVRLVGSHLWTIICFIIHQARATPHFQDALYHQHQFLLRNSQSNTSTLWDLTKVVWFWRKKTQSFARSFPLLALAISHAVLFTAAAFFSSQVASSSNLVLLKRDPACGYLKYPAQLTTVEETKQATEFYIASKANAQWALSYVDQCYGEHASTSSTTCNTLVHRTLNLTSTTVGCPFPNATMCRDDAIQMDTGYLNTARDFGINSAIQDSIDYRRVLTCSPLNHQGYYWSNSSYNSSTLQGESQYYLSYGRSSSTNSATFTFYESGFVHPLRAYRFLWTSALALNAGDSSFIPIDGLNRTDGDINLVVLFNFARYAEPVKDTWFKAEQEFIDSTGATRYRAATSFSVMGCVDQHELCHGSPRNCTGLSGLEELGNKQSSTGQAQLSVVRHLFKGIKDNTFSRMLAAVGVDLLRASSGIAGEQRFDHIGLPADQWKTEILSWGQLAVTMLQRTLTSYTRGPADENSASLSKPDASLLEAFDPCGAQMVRDPNYYSVNVFAFYFSIGVGILIILLNYTLSTIVSRIHNRRGTPSYRFQQYELDNALQVQRLAYENMGVGNWTPLHDAVPITQKGETFGKPVRSTDVSFPLRNFSAASSVSPFQDPITSPHFRTDYSKAPQEYDHFVTSAYEPYHVPRTIL